MKSIDIKKIPHINEITAQHGSFAGTPAKPKETFNERMSAKNKVVPSLAEAIRLTGLRDGMTISFHHHFRNGDYVVNMVVDEIAKMGIKNLTLAASSLTDIHAPLIEHIKNGVITHIETSGLRGKLAEEVSRGLMDFPIVFRSHGGRAAAIESGELHIDVAFLGAPSCDPYGNAMKRTLPAAVPSAMQSWMRSMRINALSSPTTSCASRTRPTAFQNPTWIMW